MTDNPNPNPDPGARPGRDDHNRGDERGHAADDGRHLDHDRDASSPRDPTEDIRQLSPAEERDLHFNGFPPYDLRPLHELCPVGGCQYKTLEENIADLDWLISQDLQPDQDDPEAGL
jgi:hypothetical protein